MHACRQLSAAWSNSLFVKYEEGTTQTFVLADSLSGSSVHCASGDRTAVVTVTTSTEIYASADAEASATMEFADGLVSTFSLGQDFEDGETRRYVTSLWC